MKALLLALNEWLPIPGMLAVVRFVQMCANLRDVSVSATDAGF